MTLKKNNVTSVEFLGGIQTYAFVYNENGKEYEGTLTIKADVAGGIVHNDYEVTWTDETPKGYTEKDDEMIAEAVMKSVKQGDA